MNEQRTANRDSEVCIGVSCFTTLPDGVVHEGVVRDISDGGARISGDATGITIGQTLDLEFTVMGQPVGYTATVAYVVEEKRSYGVTFQTGPTPIDRPANVAKRCIKCNRLYDVKLNYCGFCGSDLTKPRAVQTGTAVTRAEDQNPKP